MGKSELLPFLKDASRKCCIKEFQGRIVAIDAYSLIYKAAVASIVFSRSEPTAGYLTYCIKYIELLQSYNIKPIMVFNGQHLPGKRDIEAEVNEHREPALVLCMLRYGRMIKVQQSFQQCEKVTHELALCVINECRRRSIDCIVAPYEADAQLAFLDIQGIADLLITENVNLILLGCKKILLKFSFDGSGILVEEDRFHLAMKMRPEEYSFEKFRYMCIMSGCDYLKPIPGIGLKQAHKAITMGRNLDIYKLLQLLPRYLHLKYLSIPEKYMEEFRLADATIKHQLVYNPITRKLQPLTDPASCGTDKKYLKNAGTYFDENWAFNLAVGNIDPISKELIDSWNPDEGNPSTRFSSTASSIWSNNFKKPRPFQMNTIKPSAPINCAKIVWCDVSTTVSEEETLDYGEEFFEKPATNRRKSNLGTSICSKRKLTNLDSNVHNQDTTSSKCKLGVSEAHDEKSRNTSNVTRCSSTSSGIWSQNFKKSKSSHKIANESREQVNLTKYKKIVSSNEITAISGKETRDYDKEFFKKSTIKRQKLDSATSNNTEKCNLTKLAQTAFSKNSVVEDSDSEVDVTGDYTCNFKLMLLTDLYKSKYEACKKSQDCRTTPLDNSTSTLSTGKECTPIYTDSPENAANNVWSEIPSSVSQERRKSVEQIDFPPYQEDEKRIDSPENHAISDRYVTNVEVPINALGQDLHYDKEFFKKSTIKRQKLDSATSNNTEKCNLTKLAQTAFSKNSVVEHSDSEVDVTGDYTCNFKLMLLKDLYKSKYEACKKLQDCRTTPLDNSASTLSTGKECTPIYTDSPENAANNVWSEIPSSVSQERRKSVEQIDFPPYQEDKKRIDSPENHAISDRYVTNVDVPINALGEDLQEKILKMAKQEKLQSTQHDTLKFDQATLRTHHEQLYAEYEDIKSEQDQVKKTNGDLRSEIRTLKEANTTSEKKITSLELEKDALKNESKSLGNLRAEHSKLKDDFRNLFTASERRKTEYRALQEEYRSLRAKSGKLRLGNTEMQGELSSRSDLVAGLQLDNAKLQQKCDMLLEMNHSLDTDRRALMDHVSQLLSQYHSLLTHSLEDKQQYHMEEKQFTDKLNNLCRQKEKLEEKIMEHYRQLDNASSKKKGFGSTLVRRMRKAGSDIINKVPSRNRRSWHEDTRLTQSQFTLAGGSGESGGNDSDNSIDESNNRSEQPFKRSAGSLHGHKPRDEVALRRSYRVLIAHRNSLTSEQAYSPREQGSALSLGSIGTRRTVYLSDDDPSVASANKSAPPLLVYNRISTIIGDAQQPTTAPTNAAEESPAREAATDRKKSDNAKENAIWGLGRRAAHTVATEATEKRGRLRPLVQTPGTARPVSLK